MSRYTPDHAHRHERRHCPRRVLVVVNYLAAINKALNRMADVVERWERHHYQ